MRWVHLDLYELARGKDGGDTPGKLPPALPTGPTRPAASVWVGEAGWEGVSPQTHLQESF